MFKPVSVFKRVFILLALIFSFTPQSFALENALTLEEENLIREIGIYNSAISSMVGRFLQIDSNGNRIEGTFFLQRPDKIRFRYAPPSREEIVSAGRGFYILNREEETKNVYPQESIPLRQFLTDKIDFLNANISDVVMTDTFISISLVDESPIGPVKVSLIFEIQSKELWQWTLTEPDGGQLTFSIYDVEKNVEIPRAYFYINPNYKLVSR